MEHSPANGEFCMYNGAEQQSPESNDGFQRNKGDIRKQKRREEQRIKTIYGTRNAPHSRINGNQLVKPKLYDLFVSHINGDATLYDIREYISENGINVSNMRIDITKKKKVKTAISKNVLKNNNYWKTLRAVRKNNFNTTGSVDGHVGSKHIANHFKQKFNNLFNCVRTSDIKLSNLQKSISNKVSTDCNSQPHVDDKDTSHCHH